MCSFVLAGTVGVTGLAAGAVVGPAVASASSSSSTAAAIDHRIIEIKTALAGLVHNGTLTQAQADKVATTLDQRLPHGGWQGRHAVGRTELDVAAAVLGMTRQQLVDQLRTGKSLVQVAKFRNVSADTLIAKLVAARQQQLASAVKAGRITQTQADKRLSDIKARVTKVVNRPGLALRRHRDGHWTGPGTSTPSSGTSSSSAG